MDDEVAVIARAAWYAGAGRPREALDALREVDPLDLRAISIRGRALADLGRFADAEAALRRGLEVEPENVTLLELLASVQLHEDVNAAEETVRKAIGLSPGNPRLLSLYTLILLEQERFEWAEKMLDRAMGIDPADETVQRVRTLFMMRAAGSNAGRTAALELLRENPDEAYAHYLHGLSLMGTDWRAGLRHLREAAALSPQEPLLAETARVLGSWYLWPVHVTSGITHWIISTAAGAAMLTALVSNGRVWTILLLYYGYLGYKWGAHLFAQASINRRVARARRDG